MDKEQFIQHILPLQKKLLLYADSRFMKDADEAQDIVQEVFAKLWAVRNDLDKYNNIQALCFQITRNLCLNRIKHEENRRLFLHESRNDHKMVSPSEIETKDELENVLKIVEQLPNLQQAILRMKYIDGLEVEEIALLTGSSHQAIWMNLSRARKRVKELFNKKYNNG